MGVITSDYTVTSTGLGMANIVTDALSGPGNKSYSTSSPGYSLPQFPP